MSYVVAPPAVNPWDIAEVVEGALEVLRLDPADMDAARIERKAREATQLVDQKLDLETPYLGMEVFPAPVIESAVDLTVELFRRKDSPGGITDSWTADGSFIRLSADVMKGVNSKLAPFRGRRGVA